MFTVVPLYTSDGRHVENVRILPYKHMPEVILWGERVFVMRDDKKYYEGFCHVVLNVTDPKDNNGQRPDHKPNKPDEETKRLQ